MKTSNKKIDLIGWELAKIVLSHDYYYDALKLFREVGENDKRFIKIMQERMEKYKIENKKQDTGNQLKLL